MQRNAPIHIVVARLVPVQAVASRDLGRAVEFSDGRTFERVYGSYDELLDDSDVDVVYIPLPTGLRKEWVIKVHYCVQAVWYEPALTASCSNVRLPAKASTC